MTEDARARVLRLLHEEHRYDVLPSKAENKLPYLIQKEAQFQNVDFVIPYFWYMFGVVTASPPLSTRNQNLGTSPPDSELRPIVKQVLKQYYRTDLEEITDSTYDDAPHEVQWEWRLLDKKIRTLHDDYHDFFKVNPSREELTDSLDKVYSTFPLEAFPTHESALLDWYWIMTGELYAHSYDVSRLMNANLTFWRGVSLSLAEKHHESITLNGIKQNLGITSFDEAREDSWNKLRQLERQSPNRKQTHDSADSLNDSVHDAIVEPTVMTIFND